MNRLLTALFLTGSVTGAGAITKAAAQTVTLDYYFNNEWHRDKNGDSVRYHYTWEDKANSGFSKLGEVFTRHGFTLGSLPVAPTRDNLRMSSVYIIVDPDTQQENPNPNYVSPADVTALKSWVRGGGILILMGNDKGNAEFEHFNQLSTAFGIRLNEDCVNHVVGKNHEPGKIQLPGGDSIFKAPLLLYMKDVSSLSLQAPATPAIVHGDTVIAATARYGKGTVFVVGDPWIYNEYIDDHNLSPEFQNTEGAEALVTWIRSRVPGVDAR
jgi:unsaturated rhamnogalacturonyl hydrolase